MYLLVLILSRIGRRHRALLLTICTLFLLTGTAIVWQLSHSVHAQSQKVQTKLSHEKKAELAKRFGQMPLYFIENRGQIDKQVGYYVQGSDKALYFTPQGVTFSLHRENAGHTLKLDFVGANQKVQPIGKQQTEAVISYFKGKESEQHRGLKTYQEVVYCNLWPGIDLVYGGVANQLKYSFVVHPGADPHQIRLAWRGANQVKVNEAGEMEIETPVENLKDKRPVSYQEVGGRQIEVITKYRLAEDRERNGAVEYGFEIGEYDRSKELVVDPAMILYCGFIGGSKDDVGNAITVDGAGNAYITGWTNSAETSFPVSAGPDLTYNGGGLSSSDAFVAKVSTDGKGLVYCGYIGGDGDDYGNGLAVDAAGNVYITGTTSSTEATFPVNIGPDLTYNDGLFDGDAFVAKVSADGKKLIYCGYIGGSYDDVARSIAVDATGSAYIVGTTSSTELSFPVSVGPDLTHNGGNDDVFVAKVKADSTGLDYCGYVGGVNNDSGSGIAVDAAGNAYITGNTNSTEASFPVKVGPDLIFNGDFDAFVARVKADGSDLDYCGYIGGTENDKAHGIAVDAIGNAYVIGTTDSTESSFPVSVGPDLIFNGDYDAFAAKVKASGAGLDYCGYIGGRGEDSGLSIAIDTAGNAYITGWTDSTEASFPISTGPDLTYNGGGLDAFVAKVRTDGTGFDYCGYIGGSKFDDGHGIAVDRIGNAYIIGTTDSTEATFPVSGGPDLTHNGSFDTFIAKIGECPSIRLSPTSLFNGWFGYPYSQTLSATGGLAPYTFTVLAGELPPGLSLANDGTLSGIPTKAGNYFSAITVADASGCIGKQDYAISIFTCDVVLWPRSLLNGQLGVAYPTQTLTVTGGSAPYRFYVSGGTLPPGLSLTTNGILSGTPTIAGSYVVALGAIDANGCLGALDYAITVR